MEAKDSSDVETYVAETATSIKAGNDTKQDPPPDSSQEVNFLKAAQAILTFVFGLGGLLTVSGFIIVNVYLSRFTGIYLYSVNPSQYLAAAIGALSFGLLLLFGCFAIVILLLIVLLIYQFKRRDESSIRETLRSFSRREVLKTLRTTLWQRFTQPDILLLSTLFVILGSFSYGLSIYPQVPRFLGGGQPVPIAVIFKDANNIASFGFEPLSTHHPDVVGLVLLAELSDGLLVYYVSNGNYAAIVKNDEISGVLDWQALASSEAYFLAEATESPIATGQIMPTIEATEASTP